MADDRDDYPQVLDAAQVARLLQLNIDYVRKLSREGVLPAHRLGPQGRTFRYLKDEILDWLRGQPVGDPDAPRIVSPATSGQDR
ncbi:MAG: helix-turn-helix domain-containing protein [Actinomycetota bacterium]|jgi:excisionase family DNA binding protein|nr:helix-turn-helix domain-containing protein [Euzebyaceae bacterium]MDQ3453129.1 helix-turn-helix domain-containing protein [Actinomycetota bacterium]